MNKNQEIIIFKNDAVGDLCQSLPAINNIINCSKNITIFLSERSEKFSFLINKENIKFKKLNYDLSWYEKIKIFFYILFNKIDKIYILTPKNYYYYLAFIFNKIKFYAICIDGPNNYYRPSKFLRKYLYKFVINDRSAIYKRDSTVKIQSQLTKQIEKNKNFILDIKLKENNFLIKNLPNDYVFLHIKKTTIDKLNWGKNELTYLFNELLKTYGSVVFTKDIGKYETNLNYKDSFNVLDFSTKEFFENNNNIYLFDNIEGEDLYNTIINSSKIIAFHGMMTNLGSLSQKLITDLWYCDINNWEDYRNYRNAFYEFKPNYKGYDFIIPGKDIKKTYSKIKFSLRKTNE